MEFEGILKSIIEEASKKNASIVLPESNDIRILKAANIISQKNIAKVILVGCIDEINNMLKKENTLLNRNVAVINPRNSDKLELYTNELFNIRKDKGMTIEKAKELILNNVYFATMMVKVNDADGMVSGACHSTSDTLRPALQIIKSKENIKTVSAFFLMETANKSLGENGTFIFADCGLNEFPDEQQLVDITLESANSFKLLVKKQPKIALLSYSTKGSAKGQAIEKTNNVLNKLLDLKLDFEIDGELQLDAAIIPEIARQKAPFSYVAGQANILIFPDLQSGNIGYKLAQRFGNMLALGPITQGLNKPVNDLSRGCSVQDIVGAVAITCMQVD